jgi:hypothetical protein
VFYNDDNVVEIKPESVWLYENFISKEQCDSIIESLNQLTENDWKGGWARHQANLVYDGDVPQEQIDWWNPKVSPPILTKEMKHVNEKLKPLFKPELLFLPDYKIVRLLPGDKMHLHMDDRQGSVESDISQNFTIDCAYTLYLSDFSGGEIYYPDLYHKHTPKPGDLIIHSGKTPHQVFKVKDGIRYTVTGWLIKK